MLPFVIGGILVYAIYTSHDPPSKIASKPNTEIIRKATVIKEGEIQKKLYRLEDVTLGDQYAVVQIRNLQNELGYRNGTEGLIQFNRTLDVLMSHIPFPSYSRIDNAKLLNGLQEIRKDTAEGTGELYKLYQSLDVTTQ